jgi:hypothetical protein
MSPEQQRVKGDPRFAECRRRVVEGCGGHHEAGPLLAGLPILRWVCCADCPNWDELNPWRTP